MRTVTEAQILIAESRDGDMPHNKWVVTDTCIMFDGAFIHLLLEDGIL